MLEARGGVQRRGQSVVLKYSAKKKGRHFFYRALIASRSSVILESRILLRRGAKDPNKGVQSGFALRLSHPPWPPSSTARCSSRRTRPASLIRMRSARSWRVVVPSVIGELHAAPDEEQKEPDEGVQSGPACSSLFRTSSYSGSAACVCGVDARTPTRGPPWVLLVSDRAACAAREVHHRIPQSAHWA